MGDSVALAIPATMADSESKCGEAGFILPREPWSCAIELSTETACGPPACEVPALRRSRLSWAKQNFMRAETLTTANALLVAAHNMIPLTRAWDGGEVASADGLRFTLPVRTIHAGPDPRYFGRERGVTWYNLVSDR